MLVELLVAIGLAALLFPALATSFITSISGKAQQAQRLQAVTLLKETEEAVRSVKNYNWTNFAVNGTYHPLISGSKWSLASGSATTNGFTQQVDISDVYRDSSGNMAASGTLDPSTKKITTTISWTQPYFSSISSTQYLTRNTNLSFIQTTGVDFSATSGATLTNTQVTTDQGGEVKLANNNKGKWCSPSFSDASIDLPDGPPVAVVATASAVSINIPNDVFVATAPYATSSVKLAYVNVTADTATPAASLRGIFTLDPAQYSSNYPSSLDGLSNNFATTDVKYYTSSGGNLYALMTTTDPYHEVVVARIKNNGADTYQDNSKKIYQYWTYFNT
jgi:type II secretory pathway pseudopilin PulG